MHQLLENLRRFNRKERFFLVGQILENPTFNPGPAFREKLNQTLGIQLPEAVFAAMDYHLDWLYASLVLTFRDSGVEAVHHNKPEIIKAQQEDIDFLIAYEEGSHCHIILIEAKGGEAWNNKQIESKVTRLRHIVKEDVWPNVAFHFVFMSPLKPAKFKLAGWPSWMKVADNEVNWIKVDVPGNLLKVKRCDASGKITSKGEHWRIVPAGLTQIID